MVRGMSWIRSRLFTLSFGMEDLSKSGQGLSGLSLWVCAWWEPNALGDAIYFSDSPVPLEKLQRCAVRPPRGASDDLGHLRCREEPAVVVGGWQRIVGRDGLNESLHIGNESSSHLRCQLLY